MTSLRQELLGTPSAGTMRMIVPAGWEISPLDDHHTGALIDRLRAVLKGANRPDIDAFLSHMLRTWATALREKGGLYAILPTNPGEGTALPMSMVVSIVGDVAGQPLKAWAVAKIRSGSTEFLDEARTVLAWRSSAPGADEMAGTVTEQYHYLIPVPGADLREAVLLTGTRLALADEPEGASMRAAARVLYDAMALGLDWVALPAPARA
jgi:hypothetical protein